MFTGKSGSRIDSLLSKRFPFGFGAKKDRETGFSVLAAREMKQDPPLPVFLLAPFFARSLTLVSRSLLLNRTETLATQARGPRNQGSRIG